MDGHLIFNKPLIINGSLNSFKYKTKNWGMLVMEE